MKAEKDKITKNMTIAEVLALDESLSDIFMGFGMFCIFCHMGSMETIEEACAVHEIDLELLLKKLNENYKSKTKKKG